MYRYLIILAFLIVLAGTSPALASDDLTDQSTDITIAVVESDQYAESGDATVANTQTETATETTVIQDTQNQEQESGIVGTENQSETDQNQVQSPNNCEADLINPTATSTDQAQQTVSNASIIDNQVCSDASSGDAQIIEGTMSGDATSGNATAEATIINQILSMSNLSEQDIKTLTQDIYGYHFGDIVIDPKNSSLLLDGNCSTFCLVNTDFAQSTSSTINNNISLASTSGAAAISDSKVAGSATTGDATTLLNLVNLINTSLSTGESFVGTINIYGDLDGDILIPDELLAQLLSGSSSYNYPSSLDFTTNTTASINNDITVSATSGTAALINNQTNGSAISGTATTSINSYNLINSQVLGSNVFIVFVNTAGGEWTGLILNAAPGAQMSTIGIQSINPGSCSFSCTDANLTSETSSDLQINNFISLSSVSGNATLERNRVAGNAITGNALSILNMVNIINSNLAFSDWFGVLFINVFGSWYGSFGINTSAGEVVIPTTKGNTTQALVVYATKQTSKSATPVVYNNTRANSSQTTQDPPDVLGTQINNPLENFATVGTANSSNAMLWLAIFAVLGTTSWFIYTNKSQK